MRLHLDSLSRRYRRGLLLRSRRQIVIREERPFKRDTLNPHCVHELHSLARSIVCACRPSSLLWLLRVEKRGQHASRQIDETALILRLWVHRDLYRVQRYRSYCVLEAVVQPVADCLVYSQVLRYIEFIQVRRLV